MRWAIGLSLTMALGCAPLTAGQGAVANQVTGPSTAASDPTPTPSKETLSGTVTEVHSAASRFLLDTSTGPVWVIVTDQTVFQGLGKSTTGKTPLANLQAGEALSVGYNGIMMKSMPPQAVAERVIFVAS